MMLLPTPAQSYISGMPATSPPIVPNTLIAQLAKITNVLAKMATIPTQAKMAA